MNLLLLISKNLSVIAKIYEIYQLKRNYSMLLPNSFGVVIRFKTSIKYLKALIPTSLDKYIMSP